MSLNNIHKLFKEEELLEQTFKSQKVLYPTKSEVKLNALANKSLRRIDDTSRDIFSDKYITQVLKEGLTPLYPPILHDFRPRNKDLEQGDMGLYQRTYLPAKDRALKSEIEAKEAILEKGIYRKKYEITERKDIKEKQIVDPRRYGFRTENERIRDELQKNSFIDHSAKDLNMIYSPNWKKEQKEKWVNQKTFDSVTCTYQGLKSNQAWPMTDSRINVGDPYLEGFELLGSITRKRSKEKEPNKRVFSLGTVVHGFRELDDHSTSLQSYKFQKFYEEVGPRFKKSYPLSMSMVKSPDLISYRKMTDKDDSKRSSKSPKKLSKVVTSIILKPLSEMSPIYPKKLETNLLLKELSPTKFTEGLTGGGNTERTMTSIECSPNLRLSSSMFSSPKQKVQPITDENIKMTIKHYFDDKKKNMK